MKNIQEQSIRYPALDSLRGIAALIVILSHCHLILPETAHAQLPLWISFTPLRLLFSSYASVILFFVLSGYVLSFPFMKNQPIIYMAYLARRFCRIYLPFAATILFAATLYFYCPTPANNQGSTWFHNSWNHEPISLTAILRHLLMTGKDNDMWLDGVIWSLVYELRISIICPFVFLATKRIRHSLVAATLLYMAAVTTIIITGNGESMQHGRDFAGSFLLVLRFIPFFMIGATLARHNTKIKEWLNRKAPSTQFAILLIAITAFTLPPEIHNTRIKESLPLLDHIGIIKFVVEFILGIASSVIIISARNMKTFSNILLYAPIHWLGKVSYSLYLIHLPIFFFLFSLLLGKIDFTYIAALVITTSLLAAALFHSLIETPSIHLGHVMAKHLKNRLK
jgi:peptidoglycan/LPS O-acetylase OafA/YrhL